MIRPFRTVGFRRFLLHSPLSASEVPPAAPAHKSAARPDFFSILRCRLPTFRLPRLRADLLPVQIPSAFSAVGFRSSACRACAQICCPSRFLLHSPLSASEVPPAAPARRSAARPDSFSILRCRLPKFRLPRLRADVLPVQIPSPFSAVGFRSSACRACAQMCCPSRFLLHSPLSASEVPPAAPARRSAARPNSFFRAPAAGPALPWSEFSGPCSQSSSCGVPTCTDLRRGRDCVPYLHRSDGRDGRAQPHSRGSVVTRVAQYDVERPLFACVQAKLCPYSVLIFSFSKQDVQVYDRMEPILRQVFISIFCFCSMP